MPLVTLVTLVNLVPRLALTPMSQPHVRLVLLEQQILRELLRGQSLPEERPQQYRMHRMTQAQEAFVERTKALARKQAAHRAMFARRCLP
jgi:hypothetical protein